MSSKGRPSHNLRQELNFVELKVDGNFLFLFLSLGISKNKIKIDVEKSMKKNHFSTLHFLRVENTVENVEYTRLFLRAQP